MSAGVVSVVEGAREDRVRDRGWFRGVLARPEVGSFFGLAVVFVLFFAVSPAFRNIANVGTVLYAASTIGVVAVGVAFLMIGGEFDLSTGVAATTSGLSASLGAWYFGLNVWVGVVFALLVSVGVGYLNGWLLTRTGLPSFLVTLGTFFALQGVNLGVTRWVTGSVASPTISDMQGWDSAHAVFASSVQVGPVTVRAIVVYWVVLTAVASWVLLRTRVGNWVFAVGGDPDAARAMGVPVRAVQVGLFMFVGFCAWLLGMHLLFEYQVVQSGEGVGKEFVFIIAAVVGGCLMTGGYGSVVGAFTGALIFGMTQLGINYAGWNPDWFSSFLGVMLLLACVVNLYIRRRVAGR
ncbi:ABC transporter permease [Dermatophilus congolensis]|uniref:ABC transporter permease n=1 Tax=Dermatophilus congolensis TaxID=1863 RepID=UPI001AAFDA88|nr:ABC transporter permease [Dermatophilus congolensis]MBO3143766.1 ABC transporter permease [Dermatophilus congolensis]MBO3152757.1 ABC transporter permease [Dermatophilus congolensis]MBO3160232.1 ABC transporter permease [Dermatophilus congolensis]MBO3164042.1 ABC transporter permease [Dermatophilus congolensis]MBO3177587.1 ABC transporter permease [Dermatophilus congolensis]